MADSRSFRPWADRLMAGFFALSTAIVVAVFLILIGQLIWFGAGAISWEFLTENPVNAGREGGIASILVSTGLVVGVCLAVALPLGLATAVVLAEFTRKNRLFGTLIGRSLDVLSGVPSIVIGLFGNVFFCQIMGLGFSILAGGLTLACMVLPLLIRTTAEGLRAVPASYRMGGAALGISKTAMLAHVLLPAAFPSLVVGSVLSLGRASAETAALIFTSGYVDRMPSSIWDSGRTITVHIYDLAMNVPGGNRNAYGAALVLLCLLFLINRSAALLADKWHPQRLEKL